MRIWTLLALALTAGHANGQSIFSNPINDSGNPSTANPYTRGGQTVAANVNVTGIGRGAGVTGNAGTNRYNAAAWFDGAATNNLAGAISGNNYFTWTIAPAANYSISYNQLSGNMQASSTGPANYALQSSAGGFGGTNLGSGTTGQTGGQVALPAVSLASLGAQTSAVEFRLFGWGGSAAAGTFSINDFNFTGTATLRSQTTLVWDGGAGNGNWNSYSAFAANQSNWNLNYIPQAGLVDTLQFAGATQTSTNNNVAGLTVGSIEFNSGAAAFTLAGTGVALNNGVANNSNNLQTINLDLNLSAGQQQFNAASGNIAVGGVVSGAGGIIKAGSGVLTLSGNNIYDGGTTVNEGTLVVSGTNATGTGSVVVNNNATLAGSGTIAGSVQVNDSAHLAPGTSPGTVTIGNGLTMNAGVYDWELGALTDAGAGTNYDLISITGGDSILGGTSLVSLNFTSPAFDPNAADAFWDADHQFLILDQTAGTLAGIFGGIVNPAFANGSFSLVRNGNQIFLNWSGLTAVPEPGTFALVGVAGLALAALTLRRTGTARRELP